VAFPVLGTESVFFWFTETGNSFWPPVMELVSKFLVERLCISQLGAFEISQSRLCVTRDASAVSDAPPHMKWQVDFWRRGRRVRYSCLKEAAGEEASMQIQWCCRDEKHSGNR